LGNIHFTRLLFYLILSQASTLVNPLALDKHRLFRYNNSKSEKTVIF